MVQDICHPTWTGGGHHGTSQGQGLDQRIGRTLPARREHKECRMAHPVIERACKPGQQDVICNTQVLCQGLESVALTTLAKDDQSGNLLTTQQGKGAQQRDKILLLTQATDTQDHRNMTLGKPGVRWRAGPPVGQSRANGGVGQGDDGHRMAQLAAQLASQRRGHGNDAMGATVQAFDGHLPAPSWPEPRRAQAIPGEQWIADPKDRPTRCAACLQGRKGQAVIGQLGREHDSGCRAVQVGAECLEPCLVAFVGQLDQPDILMQVIDKGPVPGTKQEIDANAQGSQTIGGMHQHALHAAIAVACCQNGNATAIISSMMASSMMGIRRKKDLLAGITPRRILIIRLGAIGDVVFASTILEPLRRHFPQAHITWLVQRGPAALLAHHPCVDRLLIWPREDWLALWRARRLRELSRVMLAFVKVLRQGRFDVVLDLQGLLKSGLLAWSAGGNIRIGLGSREGASFLMHHVLPRLNPGPSFAGEYQHLLAALGVPQTGQLNSMVLDETECREAAVWLQALGVTEGYIVLCPFTTRPQKHWKAEHWTTLIQTLAAHTALPCLILGGPAEAARAHDMAQAHDTCLSLAGATTLRQAGAVLAGACLVIGVDTGLTHLAATLAAPTIALFGSTMPYAHVPGHDRVVVLSRHLPCSPCRRHPTCAGAFPCMGELVPGQVLQAALNLLAA